MGAVVVNPGWNNPPVLPAHDWRGETKGVAKIFC